MCRHFCSDTSISRHVNVNPSHFIFGSSSSTQIPAITNNSSIGMKLPSRKILKLKSEKNDFVRATCFPLFISIHNKYRSMRDNVSKIELIVRNENQIVKACDNASGKIRIYGTVRASNFNLKIHFFNKCQCLACQFVLWMVTFGTMAITNAISVCKIRTKKLYCACEGIYFNLLSVK